MELREQYVKVGDTGVDAATRASDSGVGQAVEWIARVIEHLQDPAATPPSPSRSAPNGRTARAS